MYRDKEEKKKRDPKLMKIGQLRSRSLSPIDADKLALEEEDTALIMEHKRQDFDASARKNRSRGNEEKEVGNKSNR